MNINQIKPIFVDSVNSIKRNGLMSIASILSVVSALMVLGIFLVLAINIQYITQETEDKLEIKIYLVEDYSIEQESNIESLLMEDERIEDVVFESSAEALEKFSDSLEDYSVLLQGYSEDNNPLPASFIVTVTDSEYLDELNEEFSSIDGVEYVKYGEEYVNALINFNQFVNSISLIIMIILTFVSLFIIYNTIKLTVFARRREIGIMKYLGSTNTYIRLPFIIEGGFLGLVGALISFLVVRVGYFYLLGIINNASYIPMDIQLAAPGSVLLQIFVFFMIYGLFVGILGSVVSISRFLDV
jgi:cell division transport system permease protein